MISRKNPALQDSPPAAGRFCLWDFVKISVKYKIHENTIFWFVVLMDFIVSYFFKYYSIIHSCFFSFLL